MEGKKIRQSKLKRSAIAFCNGIDRINRSAGRYVSLLILPLLAITVIEVVARYFFNRPTIWAWDINVQLLCALAVLGAGFTYVERGHVVVDLVAVHFSARARALIDLITMLLFFFCIGSLVWKGAKLGLHSVATREVYTSIWNPPIYYIKMAIPLGALLLLLQGIAKFIRDFLTVISSK